MADQVRLNININYHTASAIAGYAEKHQVSKTEAVRRLIGLGHMMVEAHDDKKKIVLGDERVTPLF